MVQLSVNGAPLLIDTLPIECPRCHAHIAALSKSCGSFFIEGDGISMAQAVMGCPACSELFIAVYRGDFGNKTYRLDRLEPTKPLKHDLGELIGLSPQFATIYNQTVAAEAYGLDEIIGIGYRKALEFLVKDYCITKHPKDAEKIRSTFLGAVIKEYLSDNRIQKAAERATWLGNDEAHYVRKWEQHDVQDLKKLISIAMNGILEDLEYDSLMDSFDSKKPED